jgi:LCP family protein required for cell wall assembly
VQWPGRTFTALLAVTSILVLFSSVKADKVATSFFAGTHQTDVTKTIPVKNRPKTTSGMNILLLGVDSRAGLTAAEIARYRLGDVGLGGSDTIMLVHLSPARDHATVVSFPRDLLVTIPEYKRSDGKVMPEVKMKLNAAYPRGGPDGPALTIITIEKLTGLRIDHYMSIDIPHLGRMVTALGGVEVCLPQAINDPVRNGHGSGLNLSAGKHLLNDVQAVGYVRTRYVDTGEGSSDFGRIRRQQKFMSSMMHKVTSAGTLFNVGKLTAFLRTVSDAVTVDTEMKPTDLFTIAQQLQGLDPKHVTFVTVPYANDNYSVPGVGSTVLADPVAAQGLYDAIRNDSAIGATDFKNRPTTVKPSDVSVQVLNGGAASGSAGKAAGELAAMGFKSGGPSGNAPTRNNATTSIRYAGTQIAEARTVQLALPGATLVLDDTATVIQVILGKDFVSTTPIPTATTPAKPVVTHTADEKLCTTN